MPVTVSLMDRLLADVSTNMAGDIAKATECAPVSQMRLPQYTKADYREHVRRDLEMLLNTPRTPLGLSGMAACGATQNAVFDSVLGYGVPDLATLNFSDPASVHRYCQSLKGLIEKHEQRIAQVHVQLMAPQSVGQPYRLSILAALRMNPVQEVIAFDSELMPGGQRISLAPSDALESVGNTCR